MKQRLKTMIYTPKHTKPTDENILRLLMPSVLGIILCMICLAGSTWAWFSTSITTPPQTITAANYDIAVSVDGVPVENNTISLTAGNPYEIKLTATGSADKFGGYCIVACDAAPIYNVPLKPGNSFTFTLTPDITADYTFTAVWGSYSGIEEGNIIGREEEPPPASIAFTTPQAGTDGESVYMVKSGDSLWEIAQGYDGISAEDIAAYNRIDKDALLQIGQEIQIPLADYETPDDITSE